MPTTPFPYSRAVWRGDAFAVDRDGTWTAFPTRHAATTLHGAGATPALAFAALAARYRKLANELERLALRYRDLADTIGRDEELRPELEAGPATTEGKP